MLKVGAFKKRTTSSQYNVSVDSSDKVAADAFETLIAAYYFERGFQAVCAWVSVTLEPLIVVARKAYDEL
jgi:dsRNA-specific ribonuclease